MINQQLVEAIATRSGIAPAEVLEAFRDSTREDMAAVRDASTRDDLEAVALHAHRLLGASEMLGAADVAAACRRLHAHATDGAIDHLPPALAALQREADLLDEELKRLTGTAP